MSGERNGFGDFFSFDDYMTFVDHFLHPTEERGSNEYHVMLRDVFGPALRGYLERMRDDGRLERIEGGDGHHIEFLSGWNALVDGREMEPYAWDEVVQTFGHHFVFNAIYPVQRAVEAGSLASDLYDGAYRGMLEAVARGNARWFELSADAYCFTTDVRYKVDMQDWKVVLGAFRSGQRELVPVEPVAVASVVELEVEFETGDLLVADWFRIKEFTDAVEADPASERGMPSISSVLGRQESTERHLRDHGVVTVHVGNSSPAILGIDGTLTFGLIDEDDEEGPSDVQELGRTSTDLWNVTIVEHARLVDIVASKIGPEKAERKVAEYLAEKRYGLTRLTVEPGTYHMYFSGDIGRFKGAFRSPDLPMPRGVEPMFVLSPRRLALSPTSPAVEEADLSAPRR